MSDKPQNSPLLETTQDAIIAAKQIIRSARFGAIGVIEKGSDYPLVTRTNCATTMAGNPIFLMSDLAVHTKAIKNNPRTSLLLGEPGKGDPLAHPRLTLIGQTKAVLTKDKENDENEARLRQRYLNRHPKADLYNQLPDFFLYEFHIEQALFNAGFGKAYELTGEELILPGATLEDLMPVEPDILSHMNEDHQSAIEHYATKLCGKTSGPWRMTGCDPDGIDMMLGDQTARLDFETPCQNLDDVRQALVAYAQQKD